MNKLCVLNKLRKVVVMFRSNLTHLSSDPITRNSDQEIRNKYADKSSTKLEATV